MKGLDAMVAGLVISVLVSAFVYFTIQQRQEELACKDACSPYRDAILFDGCACMDSEGRWVPQ